MDLIPIPMSPLSHLPLLFIRALMGKHSGQGSEKGFLLRTLPDLKRPARESFISKGFPGFVLAWDRSSHCGCELEAVILSFYRSWWPCRRSAGSGSCFKVFLAHSKSGKSLRRTRTWTFLLIRSWLLLYDVKKLSMRNTLLLLQMRTGINWKRLCNLGQYLNLAKS